MPLNATDNLIAIIYDKILNVKLLNIHIGIHFYYCIHRYVSRYFIGDKNCVLRYDIMQIFLRLSFKLEYG